MQRDYRTATGLQVLLVLVGLSLCGSSAAATPLKVAVSIAPVHSWVSQVSGSLWQPELLLPAEGDPHNALLRPSQRRLVEDADWVVWLGPQFETGLAALMRRVDEDRRWTMTHSTVDLVTHEFRRSGELFALPEPPQDGHTRNDDFLDDGHGHNHGHDHDQADIDPHLWLDPENARRALVYIGEHLGQIDPANAAQYATNAAAAVARLQAQEQQWQAQLAAARPLKPYVVFHDGYQYFDQAFEIPFAGAVTMNPEQLPGLRTINQMRDAMSEGNIGCLFAELQYSDRLVSAVGTGFDLEIRRLDAQGANIEPGVDHYHQMMNRLVDQFTQCV